jgi:hypothetical protein
MRRVAMPGPGAGLFPVQPDVIHYFVTPIDMTELTALLATATLN